MRYIIVILGIVVLVATFNTKILESLSNLDQKLEVNIVEQDCDMLAEMLIGLELQNVFGAKSKVLAIRDRMEKIRSETLLICEGKVLSSNGLRLVQEYFLEVDGDQYFYGIGKS